MRSTLLIAALLSLISGSSVAIAQDAVGSTNQLRPDGDCKDDRGNDRCALEAQRAMRESYGIASVETLAKQGVNLRRAMFVDGYGGDVVAITFSRVPGRSPTVEISTQSRKGESAPQPLSAVVGVVDWNRVVSASDHFDRQLVPIAAKQPEPGVEEVVVCLHSWVVVVEAVDAAALAPNIVGQQVSPVVIRRDTEDACEDGLAVPYAFELARIAREQLRECGSLRTEDARNDAALLALCHRLRGDRIAASDAFHFMLKVLEKAASADIETLKYGFFATSANKLVAPFKALLAGGDLYFGALRATDVDHATFHGQVLFPAGDDNLVADIRLELVRQEGDFRILTYDISDKRRDR